MKGRRPFKDCFRYSAAFLVIVAGACPDFEIYFQKKKVDVCTWLSLRDQRLPGPQPSLPGFDLTFSSSPDFVFQGVELLDHGPGPFGEQGAEARISPSTLVSSLCRPA